MIIMTYVTSETITMPHGHGTRTIHRKASDPPPPCAEDDTHLLPPTMSELRVIQTAPFPRPKAQDFAMQQQMHSLILTEIHAFMDVTHAPLPQYEIDKMIQVRPDTRSMPDHPMHEIIPGLFLGSERALNYTELRIHNIHLVINASTDGTSHSNVIEQGFSRRTFANYVQTPVRVIQAPLNLNAKHLAFDLFPSVTDVMDKALNARQRVLVFCKDGIARSTTLVVAYLMLRYNMSLPAAMTHVQWSRCVSVPSHPMIGQLVEWEEQHVRIHTDVYHAGLRLIIRKGQATRMTEMENTRKHALSEVARLRHANLEKTREFDMAYRKSTMAIYWVNRWRAVLGMSLDKYVSITS